MATMRNAALCALALLLSACGGGVHGTYEDAMGLGRLRFEGGGKVVQSSALSGTEVQLRYEVEDDRVRLFHPDVQGAALVLTRVDDDTLSGPMGVTYKRVPE